MDENMMNANTPVDEAAVAANDAVNTEPAAEVAAETVAPMEGMDPNMDMMPAPEMAKPPRKKFDMKVLKKPMPFVMTGLMLLAIALMTVFFLVGVGQYGNEAVSVGSFIPGIIDFFDLFDSIEVLLEGLMFVGILSYIGKLVLGIVYLVILIRIILRLIACIRAAIVAFLPKTDAMARKKAMSTINQAFGAIFSMVSSFALLCLMFPQNGEIGLQTAVLVIGAVVFVLVGLMRRFSGEYTPKLLHIIMETVRDIAIMVALIFLYYIVQYQVFGNFTGGLENLIDFIDHMNDMDGYVIYTLYYYIFEPLLRMIPAFTFMGVFYSVVGNPDYAQKGQKTRGTVGRARRIMITAIVLYVIDVAMPIVAGADFDIDMVFSDRFLELWLPMILVSIAAMLIFRMRSPEKGIPEEMMPGQFYNGYQPAPVANGYQPMDGQYYQQPMQNGQYYQQPMQNAAPQYQQPMQNGQYYQQPMQNGQYQQPMQNGQYYQQPMGGQYQQPTQGDMPTDGSAGAPDNRN